MPIFDRKVTLNRFSVKKTRIICIRENILFLLGYGESKPQNPKTPGFLNDMSFDSRYDLIASDVNQCDSLIGKSRLIDFD